MSPGSFEKSRLGGPIVVLAQSRTVLDAVSKLAGNEAVRALDTLRELERLERPPGAIVYELGCDRTATVSAAGVLFAAMSSCPVIVTTRLRPGDGHALAELCRWRQDLVLPLDLASDFRRAIVDVIAGRPRVDVVARIIAVVDTPLPGKLNDFRVFDAILAQGRVTASAVARRCDRTCGAIAKAARRAGVPVPRKQHGMHRAIIAICDVLEAGLPESRLPRIAGSARSRISPIK